MSGLNECFVDDLVPHVRRAVAVCTENPFFDPLREQSVIVTCPWRIANSGGTWKLN
jgi:hypothetical protein